MRQRRLLSISSKWATAIADFDRELAIEEQPKSTRRLRCYQLRSFAHDHRGRGPWDITRADVAAWLLARDWEAATRRSHRAALRKFYGWAVEAGHLEADPTAKLPKVKVRDGFPRPAPDDVVDFGLRTTHDLTRLAVWTIAATGVRRAECAAITKDWVVNDLRGWTLRVIGKGGRVRDIPIEAGLARALLGRPGHHVFPGAIDGHISPDWLGKLVARALPGDWTAHTLRHRFATLCYAETHDIRTVQELLGHARVTTSQVYTLVDDGAKRAAVVGARRGLRISGAHMSHRAPTAAPGVIPAPDLSAIPVWMLLLASLRQSPATTYQGGDGAAGVA